MQIGKKKPKKFERGVSRPVENIPLSEKDAAIYGVILSDADKAMTSYPEENSPPDDATMSRAFGTIESLGKPSTINIYASTGENASLSNFAPRPFVYEGFTYKNVEQAFQHLKWVGFGIPFGMRNNSGLPQAEQANIKEKINNHLTKILGSQTGAQAKKLGGARDIIPKAFTGELLRSWDENSSRIMKELLLESFKQNPEALRELLATGNATLTHTQDTGKWGREFPRLLMEVRQELSQQSPAEDVKPEGDSSFTENDRFVATTIPPSSNATNNEDLDPKDFRPMFTDDGGMIYFNPLTKKALTEDQYNNLLKVAEAKKAEQDNSKTC
jgi:predicted NAD-dependent protein-ADP-ribosyltransferase YbiA (DUF1768 family)